MGSSVIFYGIGSFLTDVAFVPFEHIGDMVNFGFISLGFIGLFYWLNLQKKFNEKAAKDPHQLK